MHIGSQWMHVTIDTIGCLCMLRSLSLSYMLLMTLEKFFFCRIWLLNHSYYARNSCSCLWNMLELLQLHLALWLRQAPSPNT
uniref:Uncharacterized protein n=1 Tax=Aegilops tauschii subsp. strangulata TaxID=200361 RepID=A0A453AYX6_AEGTS